MAEKKEILKNERFMAVDSGKFKTKVAILGKDDTALNFGFRTMISNGNFEDDAIEANTFIAEVDGKVYKIGSGASKEAALETSKMSEIHKVTTLAAIALSVNDGDIVNIAIGCPVKEYNVVEKRNAYRDYILPKGEVTVKLKTKNEVEPKAKTFTIGYTVVYPESSGVLYLDMQRFSNKEVGIIDIGGGTALGSIYDNIEIVAKSCFDSEFGGNVLAEGLSQVLSAEFSRCSVDYVKKLLTLKPEERMLVPTNGSKEHIEEVKRRSKEIIDEFLYDFTLNIKRQCDAKHWSLDYMDLVCVGRTSAILQNEIKKVFGENIYFPENIEYANALGFLRRLCAKKAGILISVESKENKNMIQGSNSIS